MLKKIFFFFKAQDKQCSGKNTKKGDKKKTEAKATDSRRI